MPRFRVRYRNMQYDLPLGEFVVGRAPGCQLILDDPRVSRRHTRFNVEAQRITVEDLKSRNGTLINGVLLRAPLVLADRDLVTIGSQELRLMALQDTDERLAAALAPAAFDPDALTPPEDPTEVGGPTPLFSLFDKALRLGVYEEAERILQELHAELDSEPRANRLRNPVMLDRVARATLAHAVATNRGTYVDRLFALYQRAGVAMQAQTIEELHALLKRLRHPLSPAMREYVEWLRAEADHLGSADRFALEKAEGLVRALRGHAG